MRCPTGHIARSSIALQSRGHFIKLLRSCGLSRGLSCRAFSSGHLHQPCRSLCAPAVHQSVSSQHRRPTRWGCRLHTTCQASAGSPHAATVEATEEKQKKQKGHLIALPNTDESASLDRIRHSVSVINCFVLLHVPPALQAICANLEHLLCDPACIRTLVVSLHDTNFNVAPVQFLTAAVLARHGYGRPEDVSWVSSHHRACHRARLLL